MFNPDDGAKEQRSDLGGLSIMPVFVKMSVEVEEEPCRSELHHNKVT